MNNPDTKVSVGDWLIRIADIEPFDDWIYALQRKPDRTPVEDLELRLAKALYPRLARSGTWITREQSWQALPEHADRPYDPDPMFRAAYKEIRLVLEDINEKRPPRRSFQAPKVVAPKRSWWTCLVATVRRPPSSHK